MALNPGQVLLISAEPIRIHLESLVEQLLPSRMIPSLLCFVSMYVIHFALTAVVPFAKQSGPCTTVILATSPRVLEF